MIKLPAKKNKVLFIKPPDRFLENEFVYQQLAPHYLQSYLEQYDIPSDILVLYEPEEVRKGREAGTIEEVALNHLNMLFMGTNGNNADIPFNKSIFENYDIVGISVMSPQAPDAYLLSEVINTHYPHITTVIGGTHPRHYQDSVTVLPEHIAFDFIVPQDGWMPMYQIASGQVRKNGKSRVLIDNHVKFTDIPAPSRPLLLMKRYNFEIAGVPAYHTITALGCPFSCNFCESANDKLRKFSDSMIEEDLKVMADAHSTLEHEKKAVMFFDDVALMKPKQVERLADLVRKNDYTTWRVFTHAYLVIRYKERLLGPFRDTGGRRIGLGLETGSQHSLDLINKRIGQKQYVREHYEAVRIANDLGIAVDAFTMIFPWEGEQDLLDTTKMIEFIVNNPVNSIDDKGRPMKNHVDSTIMIPFQGTKFHSLIQSGKVNGVKLKHDLDPGLLYFKGNKGGSGWPYLKTRLPKERYIEEQTYRNSLRPDYR
jgi:radical SAM superfamily enzyme YgiQ (UPF0313 family)